MSRTVRRAVIFAAVAATTGIVLALVDGTPDPGVAVRSYAALMGSLAALSAGSWLRKGRRTWSGAGAARSERETEVEATDPTQAAWQELERALRFGATTIGDYRLLVRPRLSALAAARLAVAARRWRTRSRPKGCSKKRFPWSTRGSPCPLTGSRPAFRSPRSNHS